MPPTETMWRDCANNICRLSSGESQMLFCILSQTGVETEVLFRDTFHPEGHLAE